MAVVGGSFQTPRGVHDNIPPRSALLERIVRASEDLFRTFGYSRIETPMFEHTEVFERGLSSESEMVTKETYTFLDRGGRSLTLRPDGTTPVMRAIIEHNLAKVSTPVKLYYTAPMFRYENPQSGRYRQHTQVGVEAVGSPGPEIDAEVIQIASLLYPKVGLGGVKLLLNSIGHPGCRAVYLPKLVEFLEAHRSQMCQDCQRKIDVNALRTFDCKVERDRRLMLDAPLIAHYLCDECSDHFSGVRGLLGALGVEFELDPRLVRGLDYYTRTTFEFQSDGLGAQNSVGGGGRYDGLAEMLGGKDLPGIGFGIGVERIAQALGDAVAVDSSPLAYIVTAGSATPAAALKIAATIRKAGLPVDLDFQNRALRSQLKAVDRSGARYGVILGDKEAAEGKVRVRDMKTGEETLVTQDALIPFLENARGTA